MITDKLPDEFESKRRMEEWLAKLEARHFPTPDSEDATNRWPDTAVAPSIPSYTTDIEAAMRLLEEFCQNRDEICHGSVARVGCDLDIPFVKISRFMPDMLEKVPTESAWRVDARPKAFAICLCIYKAYKAIEGEEEQQ